MRIDRQISVEEVKRVSHAAIGLLNELADRRFKFQTKGNLKLIQIAIEKGYSEVDLNSIIEHKVEQWGTTEAMKPYLKPSTLFSLSNLRRYHNAAQQNNDQVIDTNAGEPINAVA